MAGVQFKGSIYCTSIYSLNNRIYYMLISHWLSELEKKKIKIVDTGGIRTRTQPSRRSLPIARQTSLNIPATMAGVQFKESIYCTSIKD